MTIYYWSDAKGDASLLSEHQESIQRLLDNNYAPSDLEKLQANFNFPIFSFALNKVQRLLFTNHRGYLHVLEYLPKHQYHRSKILNLGITEKFLSKESQSTLFIPLSNEEDKPIFKKDSDISRTKECFYYNQNLITLSTEQDDILNNTPTFPTVLSGSAGTGKTLLGLIKLAKHGGRVAYITKEMALVSKTKNNCAYNHLNIDFKTYDDLIDLKSKNLVDFNLFQEWYNGLKNNPLITLDSAAAFYQEFIICSGFNLEKYCNLGERQSSIPKTTEARTAFYSLYKNYIKYLKDTKNIDPSFASLDAARLTYDFIVVDEAQNFSIKQNRQLAKLCNNAIIYCMHQSQNLISPFATKPILEQSFYADNISLTTSSLNITYRCAKNVAQVLNKTLELFRAARGGKTDKRETPDITVCEHAQQGEFYLLSPKNELPRHVIKRAETTRLAVVTIDDCIEEAREKFKTELVFTPSEIIGQEFDTIIAYKLFSNEKAEKIIKDMQSRLTDLKVKQSTSSSKGLDFADYSFWMSERYIALSRAINSLIIIDTVKNNALLKHFAALQPNIKNEQLKPISTSPDSWDSMATMQRELGNLTIADRIEKKYLEKKSSITEPFKTRALHKEDLASKQEISPKNTRAIPRINTYQEDEKGQTPLSQAIINKSSKEIIDLILLNPHCDAEHELFFKMDPFMAEIIARASGTYGNEKLAEPALFITHIEILTQILTEAHIDQNKQNILRPLMSNLSPLKLAYMLNDFEIVKNLFNYCAKSAKTQAMAIAILSLSQCDISIAKYFLAHNEVLKQIMLKSINNELDVSLMHLNLGLIHNRDKVWSLLQENSLDLPHENYLNLLKTVYESKEKPEKEQHFLYKILFKKITIHTFHSVVSLTIDDLEQLINSKQQSNFTIKNIWLGMA